MDIRVNVSSIHHFFRINAREYARHKKIITATQVGMSMPAVICMTRFGPANYREEYVLAKVFLEVSSDD